MLASETMRFLMRFSKGLTQEKMSELLEALPFLKAADAPRSYYIFDKAMRYSLPILEERTWKLPELVCTKKSRKKKKAARKQAADAQTATARQQAAIPPLSPVEPCLVFPLLTTP
jgi:hypothetical protein